MSAQAHVQATRSDDAETGPFWLGRLSDEELVLLDALHPLVLLPHQESLAPAQQDHAVVSAMRGLRARRYDVDAEAQTIALPQHVCDLLDFRSCADLVLMVQVTVPSAEEPDAAWSWQYYAYVDGDFALLEEVSPDGLHDFWALDRSELADALQNRVPDVEGAADGTGDPIDVDLMAVAAGESQVTVDCLGRALVQVDATIWRAPATPDPPLQAIVVGDRGTYVSAAAPGAEGPVRLTPITVSGVGEEVVRLLAPGTMSR